MPASFLSPPDVLGKTAALSWLGPSPEASPATASTGLSQRLSFISEYSLPLYRFS